MNGAERVALALNELIDERGDTSAVVAELTGLSRSTVDAVRNARRPKSHEGTFRKLDAYARLDERLGVGPDERRTMAIFNGGGRPPSYHDPPEPARWVELWERMPPRQRTNLIGFLEGATWRGGSV